MDEKIPELYETEEIELEKKMIYQKWDIEEIGFYWLIAEIDKKKNLAVWIRQPEQRLLCRVGLHQHHGTHVQWGREGQELVSMHI